MNRPLISGAELAALLDGMASAEAGSERSGSGLGSEQGAMPGAASFTVPAAAPAAWVAPTLAALAQDATSSARLQQHAAFADTLQSGLSARLGAAAPVQVLWLGTAAAPIETPALVARWSLDAATALGADSVAGSGAGSGADSVIGASAGAIAGSGADPGAEPRTHSRIQMRSGTASVLMDAGLIFGAVNALLGGQRAPSVGDLCRAPAATEQRLAQRLLDWVALLYRQTWPLEQAPTLAVQSLHWPMTGGTAPGRAKRQKTGAKTTADESDHPPEWVAHYALHIANVTGRLSIALPLPLSPLRPPPAIALQGAAGAPDADGLGPHSAPSSASRPALSASPDPAASLAPPFTVDLCSVDINSELFQAWQVGNFMALSLPERLRLALPGQPAWWCVVGAQDGHHALHLEAPAEPDTSSELPAQSTLPTLTNLTKPPTPRPGTTRLHLELGRARCDASQPLSAGTVVVLEARCEAPLNLRHQGQVVAQAWLARSSNGNTGLRLCSRTPTAPQAPEADLDG